MKHVCQHATARVGFLTTLGAMVSIDADTTLGKRCTIGNRVVIGKRCIIGERVTIGSDVTIGDGITIAADTVIPDGARIAVQGDLTGVRKTQRVALRAQWDALPDWIRGPYRPEFDAVNRLLDEGADAAAASLIQYAAAKPGFTEAQTTTFASVKATFATAITALPDP